MSVPSQHRAKLHSTNPLERLNGGIRRRTEIVGVRPRPRTDGRRASLPNGAAIARLVGTILLEQNDERAVRRARCIPLESVAQLGDDPLVSLPQLAG